MSDIDVRGPEVDRSEEILTTEALAFVADLQRHLGARRDELLTAAGPGARRSPRVGRSTSCPGPPTSGRVTGRSRGAAGPS